MGWDDHDWDGVSCISFPSFLLSSPGGSFVIWRSGDVWTAWGLVVRVHGIGT
jgi:hypothetical protein